MNDIKRIAFAGNPNVGKSTVFNALTGLNQHTGNWAGKTVLTAVGYYKTKSGEYCLIDTPGSYSLLPHSKEEETAGDYICFCEPDAVVIVCDAVCLERSMNLVLQILETTDKAVVCVNLIDEAKRKGITIDCGRLSEKLGVSVVPTSARDGRGLDELMNCVEKMLYEENMKAYNVIYTRPIEEALSALSKALEKRNLGKLKPRWVALKLLDGDERLIKKVQDYIGFSLTDDEEINRELLNAQNKLFNEGIDRQALKDRIASCVVMRAEELCCDIIETHDTKAMKRDRKIDKILTSKKTGFPLRKKDCPRQTNSRNPTCISRRSDSPFSPESRTVRVYNAGSSGDQSRTFCRCLVIFPFPAATKRSISRPSKESVTSAGRSPMQVSSTQ